MSRVWGTLLSGPLLAAVWLVVCAVYIHTQVGWDVLPTMLPNEIAVVVLGVAMPLAFIWMVATFRKRAAELSVSAARLAERLDAFVFPSEQAEERARTAGTALRRQA